MVFTIEEIKGFLTTQSTIEDAIKNISEETVKSCIQIVDVSSLNYGKTHENLLKYEVAIGMEKRKNEQLTLRRNSNGEKGRQWLACSPKWIESDRMRQKTKYEIIYWVNYGDDMTYGNFTVEQIIEWFDNPSIYLHELGGTKER